MSVNTTTATTLTYGQRSKKRCKRHRSEGSAMGKHMISFRATCPFYRHEDSQVIYCDGVQDGSVIHLAFASKTDAINYKERYCRSSYDHCRIYSMLDEIQETGHYE